jgi:hypothetical protein
MLTLFPTKNPAILGFIYFYSINLDAILALGGPGLYWSKKTAHSGTLWCAVVAIEQAAMTTVAFTDNNAKDD